MSDPSFRTMLDYAMKDQKVLMQLVQSDPRFMDVFSVLTGIDLMKMNEQAMHSKKDEEENLKERKKRDEENKKKDEADKKRREEENRWNSLTEEEKLEETNRKSAEELKLKGNEEFKKRNYDAALQHYTRAIELYPKELTYFLNRAGVYHELKEYDKVVQDCTHIVDNTRDFIKRAKAFGRIAYAYQEKGEIDLAIGTGAD